MQVPQATPAYAPGQPVAGYAGPGAGQQQPAQTYTYAPQAGYGQQAAYGQQSTAMSMHPALQMGGRGGGGGGYQSGQPHPNYAQYQQQQQAQSTRPPWDPRKPPPGTGRGGVGGSIPPVAHGMAGRGGVTAAAAGAGRAGGRGGGPPVPIPIQAPTHPYAKKAPPPPPPYSQKAKVPAPGGAGKSRRYYTEEELVLASVNVDRGRPPPEMAPPCVPFVGTKERGVAEQLARAPRGRVLDPQLLNIKVSWLNQDHSSGFSLLTSPIIPVAVSASDPIPAPAVQAGDKLVNARVLLCLGKTGTKEGETPAHVLHRMEVLAMNQYDKGTRPKMGAYGGLVKGKSDPEIVKGLKALVKSQCDADLSAVDKWFKLAEFEYEEGPKTVFFVPNLQQVGEGGLSLKTANEEIKSEEEVLEEGEDGKKEKVKRTVTKKVMALSPVRQSLAKLIAATSSAIPNYSPPRDLTDLTLAADLLDEWLRCGAATKAREVLEEKNEPTKARDAKWKARWKEAGDRKRKREAAIEAPKRARIDKQQALREEWQKEDEMGSDEGAAERNAQRQQTLTTLQEEEQKALAEVAEQVKSEVEAEEEEAKEREKEDKRIVYVKNEKVFEIFQIFDRPVHGIPSRAQVPTHTVTRNYLARVLLASGVPTPKDARNIVTLGDTQRTRLFSYFLISCEEKLLAEIEAEEKRKEEEAKRKAEEEAEKKRAEEEAARKVAEEEKAKAEEAAAAAAAAAEEAKKAAEGDAPTAEGTGEGGAKPMDIDPSNAEA
eukprot:Hpha_TRINITY_DN9987_c0_g1::TRINITY_DN9987_c0_g1_i1::g.140644::m.140644